MQHIGQG